MISDSQFFVLGASSSSPNNLQMYKITFSSTSADWANKIVCSQVTWSAYLSESILSSDKSTIYSFFAFGSLPTYYLYFAGLSASNGSVVTTRYKSNTSVFDLKGSALNGDYVVVTTEFPYSLVVYSISSSTFTTYSLASGLYLFGWGVEPSSGR